MYQTDDGISSYRLSTASREQQQGAPPLVLSRHPSQATLLTLMQPTTACKPWLLGPHLPPALLQLLELLASSAHQDTRTARLACLQASSAADQLLAPSSTPHSLAVACLRLVQLQRTPRLLLPVTRSLRPFGPGQHAVCLEIRFASRVTFGAL